MFTNIRVVRAIVSLALSSVGLCQVDDALGHLQAAADDPQEGKVQHLGDVMYKPNEFPVS